MKEKKLTLTLSAILIILSAVSLFIGVISIELSGILSGDMHQIQVFLISRLPRLMAVVLAGVGMSVAGLIMQQLCMNKFVSPSTGATIASSQLGILLAMIFLPSSTLAGKTVFAFISAIAGTYIFVYFMQKIRFNDIIMVPLTGIMFGSIIGGLTEYLSFRYGMVQALSSWLVGDFSLIIRGRYEIVYIVLPLVVLAFLFANHFNIVGMGEDFSKNLGVNYSLVLFAGLSIAAMITAGIVVTAGTIPYIGLIVPNIVSMFKGDRIKSNLIDTALFGAIFVLMCDMAGRLIMYPYEIPVNLTVGVLGSIIFIMLLIKKLNPVKGARQS
ncbi:ABC transporter permease [Proteocatella sphenisci]|uniref:ABC transporter permease n=1 Tax=Proteocatella sphenisci TaxID=181070 RepID=UPI0004B18B95|nr:iron chelate uptake ABC transporter family permease subunit [Proteocatella sphenisci]